MHLQASKNWTLHRMLMVVYLVVHCSGQSEVVDSETRDQMITCRQRQAFPACSSEPSQGRVTMHIFAGFLPSLEQEAHRDNLHDEQISSRNLVLVRHQALTSFGAVLDHDVARVLVGTVRSYCTAIGSTGPLVRPASHMLILCIPG